MIQNLISKFYKVDDQNLKIGRQLDKQYNNDYRSGYSIDLPRPEQIEVNLTTALSQRSSEIKKENSHINLENLSQILFWSKGTELNDGYKKTKYPTAGGKDSLDIFVVVNQGSVTLKPAVYKYHSEKHELETLLYVNLNLTQSDFLAQKTVTFLPSVFFIVVAKFTNVYADYGIFSHHLLAVEAGHLLQNISLISTTLNINTRLFSYKKENYFKKSLHLNRNNILIHTIALG